MCVISLGEQFSLANPLLPSPQPKHKYLLPVSKEGKKDELMIIFLHPPIPSLPGFDDAPNPTAAKQAPPIFEPLIGSSSCQDQFAFMMLITTTDHDDEDEDDSNPLTML